MKSFILPPDTTPDRLDKILSARLGLGLRRTRFLIQQGRILVDGCVLPKGTAVRAGQKIEIQSPDAEPQYLPSRAYVVRRENGFAAVMKPGGMHTVRGKGEPCLESCLEDLGLGGWMLVNRLDFLTSGLVLAVDSPERREQYTTWQNTEAVHKWYLALAHGDIATEFSVQGRILDRKRRVVRVLDEEDKPARWTMVRPLQAVGNNTVVLIRILKGRRHQIRAHLAHAGHPLVGDPLYGQDRAGGLFLHHWRVDLPGFTAQKRPEWANMIDLEIVEAAYAAWPRESADSPQQKGTGKTRRL
jgi:23S rRNA pseudouridine1911/1915/1917 synthase